jgi:hypothetical protein
VQVRFLLWTQINRGQGKLNINIMRIYREDEVLQAIKYAFDDLGVIVSEGYPSEALTEWKDSINTLPVYHWIHSTGDSVTLQFSKESEPMKATILKTHIWSLTPHSPAAGVSYDLELQIHHKDSGRVEKTRVYNVQSSYVHHS